MVGVVAVSLVSLGETRGPIKILGDSDFTTENGVVAGSGTAEEPYIIAGWEIEPVSDDSYGVQIENVTKTFVLRGLVIRNALEADGAAIRIGFASGGRLEQCTVAGAVVGIEIVSSTDIELVGCVIDTGGIGLRVLGERAEEYRHVIDSTNLINGLPIIYIYGADGATIEGEAASHITVAGSRNVTISENEVVDGDGILLAFVTDSTVVGNAVYRTAPVYTEHGIHLYQASGNSVRENSMWNNRLAGLQLSLASDNEIRGNQVLANHTGIRLLGADRNSLVENVVFSNTSGVVLTGGANENRVIGNVIYHENTKEGIVLDVAMGNVIERNGLNDCEVGILLASGASENRVLDNTIVAGSYGISLSGSRNEIERNLVSQESRGVIFLETFGNSITSGNTLFGNVFADNASHVYTNLDSAENEFSENLFLGRGTGLVLDHGDGNRWSLDGRGNYWGWETVADEDGNGIADEPVTVYPAGVKDVGPLASVDVSRAAPGILGTLPAATLTIDRGNGTSFDLKVLVAVAGYARWAGFRGFPEQLIEGFPGILFDFVEPDERNFTMKTVLFDLDIAFFDAEGHLVGQTTMTADSDDLYTAEEPFQYAIELPAGSLDELSIGAEARLQVP